MLRSSLLVFVLLLVSVAELSSQQLPPLERYQRVRLTTASQRDVVAIERITADSLIGHSFNGGAEVRVPLAAIVRLEVSRGPQAVGPMLVVGAGIGLLAGVGAGAALGYAAGDNRPCPTTSDPLEGLDAVFRGCGITARDKARFFGILGALPGALIGGVIGMVTTPDERWERVPLSVQVGAAPRRDGSVAVMVSRRF